METNERLLPVPIYVRPSEEYDIKPRRKIHKGVFSFFFAIYLISTLLGAALVPGKVELDGFAFSLSVAENGAPILCVERCFFALFLAFADLTAFRFPVSALFSLYNGIYTGMCVRLLLYNGKPLVSVALSALFALQMICDVSLSCAYLHIRPCKEKRIRFKLIAAYIFCFIFYFFVTYSLSLLISLMLK